MKVLVIGSGGREHALVSKFSLSRYVTEIYAAPGNAGISRIAECADIDVTDIKKLLDFALSKNIDLTVVGPEAALEQGIVNAFREKGLLIFGPTKETAQIETSKLFAKELMKKAGIPTANYEYFTEYGPASDYIKAKGAPIVVKADNLASGKGVTVAMTETEALEAAKRLLMNHEFGCTQIVIEEFLEGEEFSLMAFVNKEQVYLLEPAQDHKRAFDHDEGPNTGGMGAYSPVRQVTQEVIQEALDTIMIPCAMALKDFTGVLYGGLILTKEGPKVIEFNARFGDPETEVVLPRLKNDLYEVMTGLLAGKAIKLEWDSRHALGVVVASKGYPGGYQKGMEIKGIENLEDVLAFHMGTRYQDGHLLSNGGRVFIVVALDESMEQAKNTVYRELKKIETTEFFYRSDIGYKTFGGHND